MNKPLIHRAALFAAVIWLMIPCGNLASATNVEMIDRLPIHIVYVNHVEVESVIEYTPPLTDMTVYNSTTAQYNYTKSQLEWEMAQAESVGSAISFHMSGAFAERSVYEGDSLLWQSHLSNGHSAGVHSHGFIRGPFPFEWIYVQSPTQQEIEQHWQDNFDLVAGLVGPEEVWIGESHYECPACWDSMGYCLRTTENQALLPTGQHIVWLVERGHDSIVTYPHFPQIGGYGWHGPADNRIFFDLRIPQLKKEFLLLYVEWLERERLNLDPQVWAWGWCNHGGSSTALYGDAINEMLEWLSEHFTGQYSARGNLIARFVNDHEIKDIYESYEQSGGQSLPSPEENINDRFLYLTEALADCGITVELSDLLGIDGIRLFEMEKDPPENPIPEPLPRLYFLFRENDGIDTIDISSILAARGIYDSILILTDVTSGEAGQVMPTEIISGPVPMVLKPWSQWQPSIESPFGFHPAGVNLPGYPGNGFTDALNIGVTWTREGVYAFWFLIQPDINQPFYDFTLYDLQWSAVPPEINILANIAPQGPIDEGYCLPGSFLPIDSAKYALFVKMTVERYDGDGFEDMPGLANPIKYWQVSNEPNDAVRSDFGRLQRITYQAIKEACSECRVLIGGVAGMPPGYIAGFDTAYAPILTDLAGECVDIMDYHWYGTATGDYREAEIAYNYIRDTMTALGFDSEMPVWITEMGSYSGDPDDFGPLVFPFQSEQQQAADYIKRYIHSLSFGVRNIFAAFGLAEGFKHDGGYFDHTGLIYDGDGAFDPGPGIKKLGYFAYWKMTSMLEGSEWTEISSIESGQDNIYVYRIPGEGNTLFAVWWDYFDDPGYLPGDSIQCNLYDMSWLNARIVDAVPFDTSFFAFAQSVRPVVGGQLVFSLGENPVYITTADICGDNNGDGEINIGDAVTIINYIFKNGPPPNPLCVGDSNGDMEINVADAVYLINHIFKGGPPPIEPCCL